MKKGITISLSELITLRFQAKKLTLLKNRNRIINKSTSIGSHSALAFGRGLEFSEVREYQQGDDIRTMDWRITARTGKPHTKLYQEERERPLLVVVDYGADMFFGTRVAFKSVIAAQAAALIAWRAIEARYRIGSLIFSENQRIEMTPKAGQQAVLSLLKTLADMSVMKPIKEEQSHDIQSKPTIETLKRCNQIVKPGSTVVFISDFSSFDKTAENYMAQLALHCKVIVLFIYDPIEKNLPTEHSYPFANNRKQKLMLNCTDSDTRENYKSQFCEREAYLKNRCAQLRINFISLATNDDLTEMLSRGLSDI